MEYRYCTINDHELCLVFVNKRDQYIFMWRIPAPYLAMLPRLSTTDQDTHTNSMRRSCHQHHKKTDFRSLIPSFIVKRKHGSLKKKHIKNQFLNSSTSVSVISVGSQYPLYSLSWLFVYFQEMHLDTSALCLLALCDHCGYQGVVLGVLTTLGTLETVHFLETLFDTLFVVIYNMTKE